MPHWCACVYFVLIDDDRTIWGTSAEFILSAFVMVCGVKVNYRFLMNLKQEKRNTPVGRKGNVIEPLMSWFCWIQMFYWSYYLLHFWINANGVIPMEWYDSPNGEIMCMILGHIIALGRVYVAFNSLFVVLIRYLYICHHKRTNQYCFELVGKCFRFVSIFIPSIIFITNVFFTDGSFLTNNEKFDQCYLSQNMTSHVPQTKLAFIPLDFKSSWGANSSFLDLFSVFSGSNLFLQSNRSFSIFFNLPNYQKVRYLISIMKIIYEI